MYGAETPKKAVKTGVNRANDCCQMCKCSTQNLYKTSNRDGSRGEEVVMCESIGVTFMKSPGLLNTVRPQNQEFLQAIC